MKSLALIANLNRQQLTSEHDDGGDAKEHREYTEAETINNRRQKHPVTHHLLVLAGVVPLRLHFLHHNVPVCN